MKLIALTTIQNSISQNFVVATVREMKIRSMFLFFNGNEYDDQSTKVTENIPNSSKHLMFDAPKKNEDLVPKHKKIFHAYLCDNFPKQEVNNYPRGTNPHKLQIANEIS